MKIIEEEMWKKYFDGDYKFLFENLGELLGKSPTLYDYHNLYRTCIKTIAEKNLTPFIQKLIIVEKRKDMTYADFQQNQVNFENKLKELDSYFKKYADKLETKSDMLLEEFPKDATKKDKEILNKIYQAYLILPKLQKNGKYKMAKKINSRSIIEIILSNNELNDDGTYLFFDKYIEYGVQVASIKRFINDIHFEIQKMNSRIKSDKTG